MTSSLPPHGVPVLIPEIIAAGDEMDGKSVRVVGRVDHYDTSKCLALLSEPNKSTSSATSTKLAVKTQLTNESDFCSKSQVMVIGELERSTDLDIPGGGNVVLNARVSRCVDTLDYALYIKGLEIWKKFNNSEN